MDRTAIQDAIPLSSRYRKALDRLELRTLKDLIQHFPRRYEDRRHLKPIGSLKVGDQTTIFGAIRSLRQYRSRSGKNIVEARVEDASGSLQILWFKMTGGKRLFPIAPIHHCFQGRIAESKLVVRFWILAAVLSTLGLLALKVR